MALWLPLPVDWSPFIIGAVDIIAFPLLVAWIFSNPLKGQISKKFKDFYAHAIKAQQLERTQSFFEFCALIFLSIWVSRWRMGLDFSLLQAPTDFYLSMLDASLFCHFVSGITKSNFFLKFFINTPLNSSRSVLIQYFFAITIGAFLLMMPISLNPGRYISLSDALFTAVSALSVTGLATVNPAETFSLFGLSVLLVLIQLGGLGVVIIIAAFSFARYKRVTLKDTSAVHELYGIPNLVNAPDFLLRVFGLTLLFEFLGTAVLYFSMNAGVKDREFHALFHAISSFCNAGFSSFQFNLENAPMNGLGYTTVCILIILGGLSFPLLFEILSDPRKVLRGQLTANARLTLNITLFLLVSGTLAFWILGTLRLHNGLNPWDLLQESIFYSVVSRTAGFNSIPVLEFGVSIQVVLILLMIVGAGPLSTGGGIKTTSLGVLLATSVSFLRGKPGVTVFHREVPHAVVIRTLSVVFFYFFVSIFSILVLIGTESIDPLPIAFEVISALSTVGLSMGVTHEFSLFGKFWLMFLMITGRLGLVSILYAGLGQSKPSKFRYPEGQFYVG